MGFFALAPLIATGLGALAGGDDKRRPRARDDVERQALREQFDLSRFLEQALAETGVADLRTAQLARGGQLEEGIAAELDRFQTRRDRTAIDPIARALRGDTPLEPGVSRVGRAAVADPVEADARGRSRRTRRSRLATQAAQTRRQDIADIFGGDLASRANIASAVTGQIKEEAPKPKGIGGLFQKASSILGGLF